MQKIRTLLTLLLFIALSKCLLAQRQYDVHWVSFKDKDYSQYSLLKPQDYLSPKAIERRRRMGIAIDYSDIPVNQQYIETLEFKGFKIHLISKWMNGVAVIAEEGSSFAASTLTSLDFVKDVKPIGFYRPVQAQGQKWLGPKGKQDYKKKKYFYGNAYNQVAMLKAEYLHLMGFYGRGIDIAIFDGGFSDMPQTPVFDSLYQNNQILGTRDFVEGDEYVYESSSHGRNVLSTMAANIPYLMVGTAPHASYYLFKTEDSKGEYRIEEYTWLAAVEYADSLGVDMINSSLGYYDFDDDKMDYAFDDLDGNTAIITKAADLAAQKGVLIVNSAGNEGTKKWGHITVPGDADSILTIGAVDRDGYYAKFSSRGFDDRNQGGVKPDLVARGHSAIVDSKGTYDTRYNHGTSFSSPIMAGAIASLWGAFPEMTNMELIRHLKEVGHQYDNPNNELGYGLPNMAKAFDGQSAGLIILDEITEYSYKYSSANRIDLFLPKAKCSSVKFQLVDMQENILWTKTRMISSKTDQLLFHQEVEIWKKLPEGFYMLELMMDNVQKHILLVK